MRFPGGSGVKTLPTNAGDTASIPRSGRSPGIGSGNLLQYSCLEDSIDRGAWWATVHEVPKSWTWLSSHIHAKDMIKGPDEQLEEGVHRRRSGRVLECGSFSPCGVGMYLLPSTCMCSSTQKVLEPCSCGTFVEASSHRHDSLVTWSPTHLPSSGRR